MGTNYYLLEPNEDYISTCPIVSKTEPKYNMTHLGKSSGGWTFGLHVYPEREIDTLCDWIKIMQEYDSDNDLYIIDEYYEVYSLEKFLSVVRDRKSTKRRKIDNNHCIGYGEGTWDYLIGEFS